VLTVQTITLCLAGKSGRLHEDHEDIELDVDLWKSHVATISSVYFDSPTLDLYKGRIARIEGAKLVRVRWYGTQPKATGVVFLELKTHHESWVFENSSKQRVAIQEKDMTHVMSTSKLWTVDFAESLVRSGNPHHDKKSLRDATRLLIQIHELVVEYGLRPCVRTCYHRAAFQSSTSNELRLTIDRDVVMTDERAAPPGAWCLPNQQAVHDAPTVKVPVAVFEVKLAGAERPAFMDRLIGSGIIRDGYKFSKFLTGVATFHSDSDCLAILPYWADDPLFAHMFHGSGPVEDQAFTSAEPLAKPKFVHNKCSESTLSTLAETSETTRTTARESRSTWMSAMRKKEPKRLAQSKRVKIEVCARLRIKRKVCRTQIAHFVASCSPKLILQPNEPSFNGSAPLLCS
jgi:VTC domain